jgi:hypothetical protein
MDLLRWFRFLWATSGVAVLMTGGPGTVYGPRAFAAFVEFLEELDRPVQAA